MTSSKKVALLLAFALLFSFVLLYTPPEPILALTGEQPSYTVDDTWTYNLTIVNQSSSKTIQLNVSSSISNAGSIKDFNGTEKDCYTFKCSPTDPHSLPLLLGLIGELTGSSLDVILDILNLFNESFTDFYVTKESSELIGVHLYLYFFNGSTGLKGDVTLMFNESYPYPFKFPLSVGASFGNYTEEINSTIKGYGELYNTTTGHWDHYDINEYLSIDNGNGLLYSFFPLLNVTGTENVTVPAGTFECWKMAVINMSDPSNVIGYMWYSPEVKNIVKYDVTWSSSWVLTMELQSYSHEILSPEQKTMLLFYFLQQSSQSQFMLLLAGGAVAIAIVAVMIGVAIKRRK